MNKKLNIVIWTVSTNKAYGGIIALHTLAVKLFEAGENVFITTDLIFDNPGIEIINNLTGIENAIVIYPEIVSGNPLNAKNVIRWILYHVPEEIENTWNDTDIYYGFQEHFNSKKEIESILFVINSSVINVFDKGLPRAGACSIRKYRQPVNEENQKLLDNSVNLNEYITESGVSQLNDEFNQYEYFYTDDDSTYFSVLAALSGCKSVVLQDTLTIEQYRALNLATKRGIAYGVNDLEHAMNTKHLINENLKELENYSKLTITNFIKYLEANI